MDSRSGRLTGITTGKTGSSLSGMVGNIQTLGFAWDSHGNLQNRASARTNTAGAAQERLLESFTYDDLNRLNASSTLSSAMSFTASYDYDAYGNLTKNDNGTLEYGRTNGASLYAVTAAGGNAYHYDAYGNMVGLGNRTAQYDVFNKPTQIGNSHFLYGPRHEKVKTTSGGRTTYHFAGGSYIEQSAGGNLTTKTYVDGYYLRETTSDVTTESYLHFDHLGSVEAISDAGGNFVARMSFDAYGNRRNSDWAPGGTAGFVTEKGFTGHDMLDEEGMVHMGGRVYDPSIGRFLSADLYVQSPDNSQSYNRYSYVTNNPLSLIDPTGYQSCNANVCEEVTITGRRDGSTVFTGQDALNFMNDMSFFNNDWRQMGGGDMFQAVRAQRERSFWDNPGAHLPSLPQGLVDFSAGFGDGISFGLTKQGREAFNINGGVNESSGVYRVSELAGNLTTAATGSGLLLTGTRSSILAATAVSAEGATVSAANIYFNNASSGSLVLDSANIVAGFLFGNAPAGRVGAAVVNF